MLGAFVNSWKVPELRKRIIFTFIVIAVCRIAANIPVPGINPAGLKSLVDQLENNAGGVMGILSMFSGGALTNFAIAALGVMPYISASIIMQLMTPVMPRLEQLQREGESGRQTINQYTRYLTLAICVIQGYFLAASMENPSALGLPHAEVVLNPGIAFRLMTVIILTAGTMSLMWLGEQITEFGIGNGVSIIITINIVSRVPQALAGLIGLLTSDVAASAQNFTMIHLVILITLFLGVTAFAVMLSQGVRLVPIRHATRGGGSANAAQTTYLPLKVNFSGVMPLIFTGTVLSFLPMILGLVWPGAATYIQYGSLGYIIINSLGIIIFSFFWVGSMFHPVRVADDLKRGGAYVPGIRPGQPTAEHLDHIMTYITIIAILSLIVLTIIPMNIVPALNVNSPIIAQFFGGSTILIIVGVTLDVVRQLESQLVSRNYDGFLKRGRIKGSTQQ